jgi:hypothetical protein
MGHPLTTLLPVASAFRNITLADISPNLFPARSPNGGSEQGDARVLIRVLAIIFAVAGAVCWLWPGAIGGLLFHALPVSARESAIIGALFFAGAAILLFVRPSSGPRDD